MDFIEKVIINGIVVVVGFLLHQSGLEKEVVLAYVFLLGLDYITGLMASVKVKEDVTSYRMIRGAFYKLSLLFVLFGLGFFAKMVTMSPEITQIFFFPILLMLGAGELFSLIANVHCLKTGERYKEQVVITDYVLGFIKKFIDKVSKNET